MESVAIDLTVERLVEGHVPPQLLSLLLIESHPASEVTSQESRSEPIFDNKEGTLSTITTKVFQQTCLATGSIRCPSHDHSSSWGLAWLASRSLLIPVQALLPSSATFSSYRPFSLFPYLIHPLQFDSLLLNILFIQIHSPLSFTIFPLALHSTSSITFTEW
mmetsp:Transcript_6015/g.21233  ORF Transcript_6015/g.21233 Transcript_6015/m.21233 type:complete len:162 (+) Transcript_6015:654-1139(+)